MNDENNFGENTPTLDDFEYSEPSEKKNGPSDVTAPILDDIDYSAPSSAEKKNGPQGVSAPVLDDMSDYDYSGASAKKGAPTDVSAPVLDDDNYAGRQNEKKEISDEEIIAGMSQQQQEAYKNLPPDKQRQIIRLRREQLTQAASQPSVKPAILDDEDSYTPPPKKESADAPLQSVSAPVLDDEPAPSRYVPKYADSDLEKAKKGAMKKPASSAQYTQSPKDEKESLRMMHELQAERDARAASKGLKIVMVLAGVGVIAAALFYLFYSGDSFGITYIDNGSKLPSIVNEYSLYIAIVAGVCAILPVTGVGFFKSLCSFVYLLFSIIQIFPGCIMITQMQGSLAIRVALYAGALICSLIVLITMSASENIGYFFKRPRKE